MLDHMLAPLLQTPAQPHILTRLDNYLATLRVRQLQMIGRAIGLPGTNSGGARVMTQVLADADVANLNRSWTRDSDRWQYSLSDRLSTLERLFTPMIGGLSAAPLFVDHSVRCAEFFIPVRPRDSIVRLTQTASWADWQFYRPFRVVDVDSDELTFETHADRIRFVRRPPTRLVYTLDVAGLVLQYASYVREHSVNSPTTLSLGDYLHRYVITEALVEDLTALWLLHRYNAILQNTDTKIDLRGVIGDSARHGVYGQIGQTLSAALEDVRGLAVSVRDGNLLPGVLLASLKLSPSLNVHSAYRQLCDVNEIADVRQDRWMNFLRSYRWLEMILHLYRLNPTTPSMRTLGTALRRDLPLLISTRFWETIRHQPTRHWTERRIRHLLDAFGTIPLLSR